MHRGVVDELLYFVNVHHVRDVSLCALPTLCCSINECVALVLALTEYGPQDCAVHACSIHPLVVDLVALCVLCGCSRWIHATREYVVVGLTLHCPFRDRGGSSQISGIQIETCGRGHHGRFGGRTSQQLEGSGSPLCLRVPRQRRRLVPHHPCGFIFVHARTVVVALGQCKLGGTITAHSERCQRSHY